MSSEWFDYTEPYLTVSSQEEQGVEGNCTQIPGGSTALMKMWFGIVEPPRTHVIDLYTHLAFSALKWFEKV